MGDISNHCSTSNGRRQVAAHNLSDCRGPADNYNQSNGRIAADVHNLSDGRRPADNHNQSDG